MLLLITDEPPPSPLPHEHWASGEKRQTDSQGCTQLGWAVTYHSVETQHKDPSLALRGG